MLNKYYIKITYSKIKYSKFVLTGEKMIRLIVNLIRVNSY